MKINPDKCHLLVSSCGKIKMELDNFKTDNSTYEKLLGVHFDNRLNFDYHISGLCKKAGKKNQCNSKSQTIHELIKKKNLNECFLWITLQVWSTHMDVP